MAKSTVRKTQPVRTSVMLTADRYAQIQALADVNQVSIAWVIRHALLRFLNERTVQLRLP